MYKSMEAVEGMKCVKIQVSVELLAQLLGLDTKNFVLSLYRESDDLSRNTFKMIIESPYVDRARPEGGDWPTMDLNELLRLQNEYKTITEQ